MQFFHKPFYHFGLANVLTVVFRKLACIVEEGPCVGYLTCHQLDDNIHWLYVFEVVGEVSAYSERRLTIVSGILLYAYGLVGV